MKEINWRITCRWENNIKIDLKKNFSGCVWTGLIYWQAVWNVVLSLQGPCSIMLVL